MPQVRSPDSSILQASLYSSDKVKNVVRHNQSVDTVLSRRVCNKAMHGGMSVRDRVTGESFADAIIPYIAIEMIAKFRVKSNFKRVAVISEG